jgi:hypothetical protein
MLCFLNTITYPTGSAYSTSAVSYTCKMFIKSTSGEEVAGPTSTQKTRYRILSSKVCTFFTKNDAEILPAHYTWKVAFTFLFHKQSIEIKL